MKKNIVLTSIIAATCAVNIFAVNSTSLLSTRAEETFNSPRGSAQLTEHYYSLDELAEATPTVVSGKLDGKSEKIEYKGITFIKSEIKLKEVYRDYFDDLEKGDTITLLQTYVEEDPIVEKNDEVLLYLKKYDGPVIKDAYRIVGLMQGHFKLDKDGKYLLKKKPKSSKKEQSHNDHEHEMDLMKIAESGFTVEEILASLEKVKYSDPSQKKTTTPDEEAEEERRKKILDDLEKSGKLGDNK